MKILVTGGAGYIGSFVVRYLAEQGMEAVILDNLSLGNRELVKDYRLEQIDLLTDKQKVLSLLQAEKFDGIIHMASNSRVGESVTNPSVYYNNNVVGFINLLDSMKESGTNNLILSSSAAVYGVPESVPIPEDAVKNPVSPYGQSKLIMENMLKDYDNAYGIKSVSIRYFNAAGAALDGSVGEAHLDETHLIPNIIKKAIEGSPVELFGDDYDTADGTCIRDYIHVLDLAENHTLALKSLFDGSQSNVYNAGMGHGYSVKEVVQTVQKVTGLEVKSVYGPRRPGDPPQLVADTSKINQELGWKAKYSLEDIVKTAFKWHSGKIKSS
jgi:UDP-glucose 4-epimerase